MKTVKILLLFVAAVAMLSACKDDDEIAKPTLSFTNNVTSEEIDFSAAASKDVLFNVTVKAEGKIKNFTVKEYYVKADGKNSNEITDAKNYSGKTDYTYTYEKTYTAADFADGVTKIEVEFYVVDNEGQGATKVFTITQKGTTTDGYKVTFTVKDAAGTAIQDAEIEFNGKKQTTYVFEGIAAGDHAYKVNKSGYSEKTGTVNVKDQDVTVDVVLDATLGAYTRAGIVLKENGGQNVTYDGVTYSSAENTVMGIKYKGNYGSTSPYTARIETISATATLVEVNNDSYTTVDALETAYTAGTKVSTIDFYSDDMKAYAVKYFISKVGENYILVKYVKHFKPVDGQNLLLFDYK